MSEIEQFTSLLSLDVYNRGFQHLFKDSWIDLAEVGSGDVVPEATQIVWTSESWNDDQDPNFGR